MGSQITIWQNESDELTFCELIFDEFSRGTCAQKHTQRIIALPHHQKEKKKIQGVPRVYSNGKADEVDRKSSHIQRSSTVYWEPYVHYLRSPFTSAQLGILSFMCREIHPRCLTLEPRSVP